MEEKLGEFVAARRKYLNITQKEMGESLGYTPQGISKFENENSGFPITSLPELCLVLKLSMPSLFQREGKGEPVIENIDPIDPNLLRNNIKAIRHHQGWSQEKLAKLTGLSKRTITNYETGSSVPSVQFVESFALLAKENPCLLLSQEISLPKAKIKGWQKALIIATSILVAGGGATAIALPLTLQNQESSPRRAQSRTSSTEEPSSSEESTSEEEQIFTTVE